MYEQFMRQPQTQQNTQTITVDFSNMIGGSNIKSKLSNIDSLTNADIYNIFGTYLNDILDCIFKDKDQQLIELFTNARFITIATQAMYNITPTTTQRRRLNKLAYDYLILKNDNKSKEISALMINFSKVVNKDITPRLCGYGLSEEVATMIALARYSSEREITNTKRLNRVIMQQPMKIMTEQMIVDIYCALYTSALDLFEGVMYDIASYQTLNENEKEIYGTITLALLDIINELPMSLIKEVLRCFTSNQQMLHPDSRLRFNIESFCPEDYPRLDECIQWMKNNGEQLPIT